MGHAAYNGHLNSENSTVTLGDITDRNGNLLATTQEGARIYSPDETVRRSLLHTVGDLRVYLHQCAVHHAGKALWLQPHYRPERHLF